MPAERQTVARLRWFGCTTFLLELDGVRLLLDAYLNRVAGAPPTGVSVDDVTGLDAVLIGHSHSHHMADAPAVVRGRSTVVLCHPTGAELLKAAGVPESQLRRVVGGERYRLSPTVTVRTFPSLHACDWMPPAGPPSEYVGLDEDGRVQLRAASRRLDAVLAAERDAAGALRRHLAESAGSEWHGGVVAYLIEWSGGSVLFQDSIGAWSGIWQQLRPDLAVLSASGVPNLDGEPFLGSVAGFVAAEAAMLGFPTVVPCHHDDWMPPFTTAQAPRDTALVAEFRTLDAADHLVLPSYGAAIDLGAAPRNAAATSLVTAQCPVCERSVRALYTSTSAENTQTRLFCTGCSTRPEYADRMADPATRLRSVAAMAEWSARRMMDHALGNERRRRSD